MTTLFVMPDWGVNRSVKVTGGWRSERCLGGGERDSLWQIVGGRSGMELL
ncbi:MAG: hypothetical protein GX358_03580 [candidate division WS1 bacterium]|nr:hypothetical protein [candidate division WS1 bacterium]